MTARNGLRFLCTGAVALGLLNAADTDFVAAVTEARPVCYFRLDSAEGQARVGSATFRSMRGAMSDSPGPFGGGSFVRLDGKEGYIVTTQSGGVRTAATILAWVNLASLPSQESHHFYVAGESQNGNDLDLQFETDNALKFFTSSGGSVSYKPSPETLVNQWHMITATMDAANQRRILYWDGKQVTADRGGGGANKSGVFTIGESTVFKGRHFQGGVAEVALWNRALPASEIAAIYTAAMKPATDSGGSVFSTTAQVDAEDSKGPIPLKQEEKIALVFLSAIEMIERDCQDQLKRACTMEEVLAGQPDANGRRGLHLKFDPRKDPNFTYAVVAKGTAYLARATAKKTGLIGFCWFSRGFPTVSVYYNRSGSASVIDDEVTGRGVNGDSFAVR